MSLLRFIICLAMLITSSQVIAISPNPFDKAIVVTAGHDVTWQFGEQTATKSVKGADGTWYHLFYDGLRLRLRLTGSSQDSQYAARQFEEFAVYDVKIDGNRIDIFQWCLNNQEKHNRFLQQGLSVKKEVCQNLGEQGSYVMRLTKETIDALDKGNVIEYELKPFRTKVLVKFGIDDFDKVNNEFKKQYEAKLAASQPKADPAPAAPVATVAAPKPKLKSKPKCKIGPPEGFSEVKTISYDCDDVAAKNSARASVDSEVNKIREKRNKAEAELERKRKQAEAARLAKEEALRKEQEALAASAAIQAELSTDIATKMIAVCEKNWAEGEHRCYCEKYIKYAPANIKADSSCK
jgi:predicted carbohydrate-binding protein with CBM5 and CBM33 domain